jgi:hypothetical protein
MSMTSNALAPRTLRGWIITAIITELAWFALIHPLVPRTLHSALVLALCPVPIVLYAYAAIRTIARLADSQVSPLVRKAGSLALTLSVGLFIFGALWLVETYFSSELGYFYFHHL